MNSSLVSGVSSAPRFETALRIRALSAAGPATGAARSVLSTDWIQVRRPAFLDDVEEEVDDIDVVEVIKGGTGLSSW